MAPATLILLAGGRSTRFGKPKQLEPVGPQGEALLDFTLRDAFACGCGDAVIVVKPEHEAVFAARCGNDRRITIVVQHEAAGTAHATMIAVEGRSTTMVLANGDDHYGKEPILLAAQHALHGDADEHALVAFTLANTLGASGDVNRAVCETDGSEMLLSTEEVHGLHVDPSGGATDATGRAWEAHRLVSMNLWVLRPSVLPLFRTLFQAGAYGPGGEFGLPAVVDAALERHHRFRVLPTKSAWCGLTYPDDAELVRRMLADRP